MSTTAHEPEVTPEENEWLMQHLRPLAVDSTARTSFLRSAIDAIEAAHDRGEHMDVDQFGANGSKSPPIDVARASLQQILAKGGTTKGRAYKRWYVILSLLGRNGHETERDGLLADETPHSDPDGRTELERQPARAEPETEGERVEGDLLRRVETLETQLAASEASLRIQKERADKLDSTNRVLKGRVKDAEGIASELKEAEANARRSASRHKSEAGKAKRERDELREQIRQAEEPQTEQEATYEGEAAYEDEKIEAAERDGGFRDELGTYMLQLLGTTEYSERPPQWILDRVDRLAGI